jgi:aryl-alcohol dehydrogenase-like predicted oxidoreductase
MTLGRRGFVKGIGAAAVSAALLGRARGDKVPRGPQKGAPKEGDIKLPPGGTMPMRTLGRTGVKVSLLGLGGYHLGIPKEDKEAVRIIHAAMDHGVTFLDNCWDYNDGKSEERMGLALADGGRRHKAFLMTKLDGRTKDSAEKQLEQSLQRLRTDTIDLVQVHEVIRMEDPDRVFGPGGAIEALVAAKKAGKLRFIGFTGHKDPAIHLHMLDTAAKHGFVFDTVQMPVNVMDAHYKSFAKNVIPRAREKEIGVLGMKPLGSGIILQSGAVEAPDCLRYSMSQPVSVQITGCDTMGVLEQALSVALGFSPMPAPAQEQLLARTAEAAADGRYERFKTSSMFDGTASHPKWLETAQL